MSLVSVITCTGFRPEAFKLCFSYMQRQTYLGPVQWIIVNDAYTKEEVDALPTNAVYELYAGPQKWQEGLNTQRSNMVEALSHVKGDYILIMEDEDFYKPDYIEVMMKLLQSTDIVGGANSRYYHVGVPGWKEMHNYNHASLCETGLKKKVLPLLLDAVNSGELFFDVCLWRKVHEKKIPYILHAESNLVVGMKGMPGRAGIGVGHKVKDYLIDSGMLKLKEWLGADADNYLPFIKSRVYERRDTKPNGTNTTTTTQRGERNPGQISKRVETRTEPRTSSQTSLPKSTVVPQSRHDASTPKPVSIVSRGPKGSRRATPS
jgi:hypothetical protein